MTEERWFFWANPASGAVELLARFEGDDGVVGDARDLLRPGEADSRTPGLTYDVLADAGTGTLVIHADRTFTIVSQPEAPSPPVTDDDVRALFHPDLVASAGISPQT